LTALPDDWKAYALKTRPDLDPLETWDRFRDYWIAKPGKDGLKADWLATWRNWVRNERQGRARNQASSVSDRNRAALDDWLSSDEPAVSAKIIEGEFRREAK
jgi:hypothetical protein